MDYEELEAFVEDFKKGLRADVATLKKMPGDTMSLYNFYANYAANNSSVITEIQALDATDPVRLRMQKYNVRRGEMENLCSDLDTAIRAVFTVYGITL